jgi:hypothetical protein
LSTHDSRSWARFEDEALAQGFTQIPNAIVRNPNLSMQAKYLYGLLLSYAWNDPDAYPGLERLRRDTGAKVETLRKYLYELSDAGVLGIERRGRGKTNLYTFKALTSTQDNPQRGWLRQPPTGVVKTTPNGGHNEYAGDKDTENSSRRDAGASPNYFALFTEQAKASRYPVTDEDRKELPGNLKRLAAEQDDATMRRIVLRCLEARMRGYPLSPQRALIDASGGGGARADAPAESATPEERIKAVANRVDLRRYAPLLEKWDFRRPEDPPWQVRKELGGTDDERQRNLTRIRSLVGQQKRELSEEARRLQEENERLTAEILRGVV